MNERFTIELDGEIFSCRETLQKALNEAKTLCKNNIKENLRYDIYDEVKKTYILQVKSKDGVINIIKNPKKPILKPEKVKKPKKTKAEFAADYAEKNKTKPLRDKYYGKIIYIDYVRRYMKVHRIKMTDSGLMVYGPMVDLNKFHIDMIRNPKMQCMSMDETVLASCKIVFAKDFKRDVRAAVTRFFETWF